MVYFKKNLFRGTALVVIAALGSIVGAAPTLTLSGLHTNTNVSWTLSGMTELSGSGAFYGSYTDGVTKRMNPLFCIDLFGWVSLPSSFAVQRQSAYNAAGWLVKTYGKAAMNNGKLASALQFAIWNVTYDNDLTVSGGTFKVNNDYGSGAAAQANVYLASIGNNKAGATTFIRTGSNGQSQITAVPGPSALAPFVLGAMGAMRRRKKSR